MFTKKDTPAKVVKVYPQASDLFKKYKINFCCQGETTIERQAIEKNVNVDSMLLKLNQEYDEWKARQEKKSIFSARNLEELIEEIFSKQRDLTDELSSLKQYVERVSLVHGNDQPHLKKLEECYIKLLDIINHHFEDELIFISLMKEPNSKADLSLASVKEKLQISKAEIEKTASTIKEITNNFVPPNNACGTYKITYSRLSQVDEGIADYMTIDENLFSQSQVN